MSDHQLLEPIDRGGHRLGLDAKDGDFRIICNSAVHARFSTHALGEIEALKCAVIFLEHVEAKCLKYPIPNGS